MDTLNEFQKMMAEQTDLALATIGTDAFQMLELSIIISIPKIILYTLQHLKITSK